jgi:hypothetical protein
VFVCGWVQRRGKLYQITTHIYLTYECFYEGDGKKEVSILKREDKGYKLYNLPRTIVAK